MCAVSQSVLQTTQSNPLLRSSTSTVPPLPLYSVYPFYVKCPCNFLTSYLAENARGSIPAHDYSMNVRKHTTKTETALHSSEHTSYYLRNCFAAPPILVAGKPDFSLQNFHIVFPEYLFNQLV